MSLVLSRWIEPATFLTMARLVLVSWLCAVCAAAAYDGSEGDVYDGYWYGGEGDAGEGDVYAEGDA